MLPANNAMQICTMWSRSRWSAELTGCLLAIGLRLPAKLRETNYLNDFNRTYIN